jgi:cobalt-zinc-cadmium resistance protein CzcA
MIDKIIDYSLKHRLLTILLIILVSIFGIIAYTKLPKDIYPDLNAPLVKIITENPGMAAEDVERLISFPLESLLNGAPLVARVRSESTTGDSVVTVEFDWGTDIYLARQIVSSVLELIAGRLPLGTTEPILGPVSSRMGEIFEFAVISEEADPMELRSVADWTIRYRLQGVEGVSFVINLGGFVKQFQVFLKPEMLKNYDITINDVKEAIENSNRNFSGGIIIQGSQESLIKGIGRIESLEHIQNTVITSRNNVPVYVKDVADVKVGGKFRRDAASHNAQEAVYVTVEKQYGGDTLTAIRNVKEALSQIERDLPQNIKIKPFYDQSILILKSISHVELSILEGAFLIILVMLFFMWHVRSSLIASLTIPFSILIALVLMWAFNIKLTVMSIGGLAIGIGKVANGSIIMVENIYRVLREKKGQASTLELTSEAAKDVGKYLFSANVIIILVFLPLLTLQGIEGAMFIPTAFAVAAALFGSLLLNLTLKPVLCSMLLTEKHIKEKRRNPVTEFLSEKYERILKGALEHKRVILTAFILFIIGALVAFNFLGKEFVPPLDEGQIMASTVMLPETSITESIKMGTKIEKIFLSFPEVVSVSRTTGTAEASEHLHPVNHSHYNIELLPREKRKRDFEKITAAMRVELDKLPGVAYIFEQPIANKLAEMLTGTEGQLSVKLFGPDLNELNFYIEDIRNVLAEVKGVADLQIEQTTGIPQLVIHLDRGKLARYGIRVSDVADVIETALNGIEATDVYEPDRITSVLIRLPEKYRSDEEGIKNLLVDAPNGERIPLSQLAEISKSEGPQTIFRENLMRRKLILCNVVKRDIGSFVEEAKEKIEANVDLPAGYYFTFGGQYESQQRALEHLTTLMIIVILIIFVILFTSFGSIWQALLIILNIPSTLIGGILGLLIAGQTLNVSSTIGLIALFGICVQNDVILVAKINDFRKQGLSLHEAVMKGALTKFRPILMTDLVMIVAVLPMALIVTTGAELHRPLAVVYIGGFFFAILLRLIVVPVLYETFGKLAKEK